MNAGPLLSICIATFRRGRFIVETLDSIVPQLSEAVELVVVDGASPDDTEAVMRDYTARHPQVRYIRQAENGGVDADYDHAVGYARGTYCWLMTDDDLMRPGAVALVLEALQDEPALVVVNSEVRSADFSTQLSPRLLDVPGDRRFPPERLGDVFTLTGSYLSFIGAVVVRRALWQTRDRRSYYGTLFIHFGVLFQEPVLGPVTVLAEPLLIIRFGNAMWTPRSFEIWMKKWPQLVWSFPHFTDEQKRLVSAPEPARSWKNLILQRALGGYSPELFERFLAADFTGLRAWLARALARTPPAWLNAASSLYCRARGQATRTGLYQLSRSEHAPALSRWLARDL